MPRFRSLFAPIRRSLVGRDDGSVDPFRPLADVRRQRPPVAIALAAPVGPRARNRPGDVARVERALARIGGLGSRRPRSVFDRRLETGVRDFQRQRGLQADGLLNPAGPTIRMLDRALARPPLRGLSGEAASANARLVRHLMTTTADGIVPDLMAADFRAGEAGRAKTADFLSRLFRHDATRARGLRAKAGTMMSAGARRLLDALILQARLADEPPDDDVDDLDDPPPEHPPKDPGARPYDPGHPRPGDPDDPGEDDGPNEPDDPDKPEKPKPDKDKCDRLKAALANAEQAIEEARERFNEAAETYDRKRREVEARWQDFLRTAAAFGIGNLGAIIDLRKGRIPRGYTLPSEVAEALASYRKAFQEATTAIERQKAAEADLEARKAEAQEVRERLKSAGCE